jgi:chlorite dismutase
MSTISPEAEHASSEAFPAGLAYTAYVVFSVGTLAGDRAAIAAEAEAALSAVKGVAVRGCYDTTGYRADCELMLWLAGDSIDAVQQAIGALRCTALGRASRLFWSAIGVHREAEFNRAHVPAFFAGESPKHYLCAYPYVRTTEWYLLEPEKRRDLLIEHGRMGREYPDVRANTVSAFGLGDYEWLLAFEADDPVRIVDLIRHLRSAEARLYTKNELPFVFGLRKPLAEILTTLP